ncbi:hypothetical protein ILUMI_11480 [Ignelater luminosus]|uniref:C2H2-type domain-containing protein n=1 Tax=Ignelater luminosus TaxID=2038154 RepID=A0A8K0CYC2_IGNLU|nr:hypothetical protein ILUMI_11480 [Ignelater luminosus]
MECNNNYTCELCNKNFKWKKNLYSHQRNTHKFEPTVTIQTKLKCCFCELKFGHYDKLRSHLTDAHEMDIFEQNLEFKSFDDFNTWKGAKEKEFHCFYAKKDESFSSKKKTYYYICHRSGFSKLIPDKYRKRRLKSQGSFKMNCACPSTIKVVENIDLNLLEVTIWTPHTHDESLQHMNLTKEERTQTAGKLSTGVPFDRILNDVRDCANEHIKRTDLLNRKDLRNIQKEFSINESLHLYHNDDKKVLDRIKEKIDFLRGVLLKKMIDHESLMELEKKLDNIIQFVNNRNNIMFVDTSETTIEPANKQIASQICFVSLKKKGTANTNNTKNIRKSNEEEVFYKKDPLDLADSDHSCCENSPRILEQILSRPTIHSCKIDSDKNELIKDEFTQDF